MTITELITTRTTMGLSRKDLAGALGVSWRTVERWEQGRNPIPAWVGRFLECLTSR